MKARNSVGPTPAIHTHTHMYRVNVSKVNESALRRDKMQMKSPGKKIKVNQKSFSKWGVGKWACSQLLSTLINWLAKA